jgi:hypothetical protein
MSPVTGRVIGTSEVRVVKSKEAVTGLRVKVITGIGLAVTQEVAAVAVTASSSVNIFSVETTLNDKLNAKYQVSQDREWSCWGMVTIGKGGD